MNHDPATWSDPNTLKVGDTFTEEWLDLFRALMAGYNEVKSENAELLKALKSVLSPAGGGTVGFSSDHPTNLAIRAIIAKADQNRQDTPA